MTDIVKRLRASYNPPAFWMEAADEIERLRNELAGAMMLVDMTRDAAIGHQERAERLRAALRRISLASQNSGTTKEFLGKEARVALGEDINDRHH